LIGERGTRLSGGQRQRIAIARALLRDAPILILDEALSSVDAENEAVIQEALDRLVQGRTTLILAHRLSSVIAADRIIVLEGGRVVESGRHDELIHRDGPYRRLMGTQAMAGQGDVPNAASSIHEVDLTEAGGAATPADETGVKVRDISADAVTVGWRETISTLMRFIRPWLAATGGDRHFGGRPGRRVYRCGALWVHWSLPRLLRVRRCRCWCQSCSS
jgi:ATP-binding cassette subfamily C protein CydCD